MSTTTPLHDPDTSLIRLPEVMTITGLSRPTLYRRIKAKKFPQPVPLSDSVKRQAPVGFVLGEVKAWVEAQKSARKAVA